jgi:hypothetical protein
MPTWTISPTDCGATFTVDLQFIVAGVAQPLPNFLVFDPLANVLSANLGDPTCLSGTY